MIFDIDNQTKNDLDILPFKNKPNSIFSVFDNTQTNGGKDFLLRILNSPVNDIDILKKRKKSIEFLNANKLSVKLDYKQFDDIEFYIRMGKRTLHDNYIDSVADTLSYYLKPTSEYYNILNGIKQLYQLSLELKEFLHEVKSLDDNKLFIEFETKITEFINIIHNNSKLNKRKNVKYRYINKLDNILRNTKKDFILDFINEIYQLDAYLSVSKTIDKQSFKYAEYIDSDTPYLSIKSLRHPFIENAITNDIELGNNRQNQLFLTGPNMAGKSTFLKSIGISIYLAHTGLPVPAASMKTTLFNGLNTTINLSDKISLGYSHYFSEVNRVKEIASKFLKQEKHFVIFDELFRGTNVKDALEASYKLMNEFTMIKSSLFIISSHINEISDFLNPKEEIKYKCFHSTLIDNDQINYDYKLKNGISTERMGIKIIENEKIFEILKKAKNRTNHVCKK